MKNKSEIINAAKNGDKDACEILIEQNAPLIWSIVRRFTGRGVDSDDLYQLGCIGMLKAIIGFDEGLGNQFSTYAVPKIAGEIRRFLRDDGTIKVSRTLKERSSKIRQASENLRLKLNREPFLSEISELTGFTPEEITEAECATAQTDSLSREIGDDGQTLGDLIGNNGIEETTLDKISLSDAIATLSHRERMIITLRYYRCMTQQQVAKIIGISQVQVSRIERTALNHLRDKCS